MEIYYVEISTRAKGDRKDRVHMFYVLAESSEEAAGLASGSGRPRRDRDRDTRYVVRTEDTDGQRVMDLGVVFR